MAHHHLKCIPYFLFFFNSMASAMEPSFLAENFFGTFTVFDVGTGNCQFVHYPQEGVAILFDAGSSAEKKHIKLTSSMQAARHFATLTPAFPETPDRKVSTSIFSERSQGELSTQASLPLLTEPLSTKGEQSEPCDDREDAHSMSNEADDAIGLRLVGDTRDRIRLAIEQTHARTLVVFISHPDKDHLNFFAPTKVRKSVLPDASPLRKVVMVCGGDFFKDVSQDTKALKAWCKKRQDIMTFYPYKELPQTFIQKDMIMFFKDMNAYSKGELEKFLGAERFSTLTQGLRAKVYIWGMNHQSKDKNAQSIVLSFKLAEDTSFIVTGDAEDETFQNIARAMKQEISAALKGGNVALTEEEVYLELKKWILGTRHILMAPHHGAEDNISQAMVQLFDPHLVILSSGNGKLYPHPYRKVCAYFHHYIKPEKSILSFLEDNYVIAFGNYSAADCSDFYKKKKKTTETTCTRMISSTTVISTNYSGDISFREGCFYRTLVHHGESAGDKVPYLIDFSKRLNTSEPKPAMAIASIKDLHSVWDTYTLAHTAKCKAKDALNQCVQAVLHKLCRKKTIDPHPNPRTRARSSGHWRMRTLEKAPAQDTVFTTLSLLKDIQKAYKMNQQGMQYTTCKPPKALCFGNGGKLYLYATQLQRSSMNQTEHMAGKISRAKEF